MVDEYPFSSLGIPSHLPRANVESSCSTIFPADSPTLRLTFDKLAPWKRAFLSSIFSTQTPAMPLSTSTTSSDGPSRQRSSCARQGCQKNDVIVVFPRLTCFASACESALRRVDEDPHNRKRCRSTPRQASRPTPQRQFMTMSKDSSDMCFVRKVYTSQLNSGTLRTWLSPAPNAISALASVATCVFVYGCDKLLCC